MDWTIEQARDLYGIRHWVKEYFDLNEEGEVVVNLPDNGSSRAVSLKKIIDEIRERGRALPLILRFRNLLDRRIEELNGSFQCAMEASGYRGGSRGVYPGQWVVAKKLKISAHESVIPDGLIEGSSCDHLGQSCTEGGGSRPFRLLLLRRYSPHQ